MTRPVFGEDRDPGVVADLFPRLKSGALASNPMLVMYGEGPPDRRCRDCDRFRWYGRYGKCDRRENSNSTRTDHRATWPTCGKFTQGEET